MAAVISQAGLVLATLALLALRPSDRPLLLVSQNERSTMSDIIRIQLTYDGKLPYSPQTSGFSLISFYNAVLGRLYLTDENGALQPGLLQLPRWNEEKQWYEVELTPGTKFHNGRLATAHDLEFSLVRFFITTGRADQRAALREIVGVESLKPGMTFRSGMAEGIIPLNMNTIAIKLRRPRADFFYNLIEAWISLVPFEELENDYATWKSYPIGAGPYRVASVDPEEGTVQITRINDEQTVAPRIVEFVSDPSRDDADIIVFQPMTNSRLANKAILGNPVGYTGLFFNPQSLLAKDARFRRAVSLCVTRPRFNNQLQNFTPLAEVLTSNFPEHLGLLPEPNLAEARRLASELNLPGSITVPVHFGTRPLTAEERSVLENLRRNFSDIGLQVSFVPTTVLTFENDDVSTPFRLDRRGSAFHDPMIHLTAFAKGGFLSAFYPENLDHYTEMVDQVSRITSPGGRNTAVKALNKFLYDQSIVVPLYEDRKVYWINPERISSVGNQDTLGFDVSRLVVNTQ